VNRTVRVTIVKEYTITEQSMREGVYDVHIQKLAEEGALEEAYAMAMAVDVANLDDASFGIEELLG